MKIKLTKEEKTLCKYMNKLNMQLDKVIEYFDENFCNKRSFHTVANSKYIKLLKMIANVERIRGRGHRPKTPELYYSKYNSDLPLLMAQFYHVYIKD